MRRKETEEPAVEPEAVQEPEAEEAQHPAEDVQDWDDHVIAEEAPEPDTSDDEPPEMDDDKVYGTVDLTRPHRMERRTLPCTMNDDELAGLAISMARILREIGRIKAQHKRVATLQEQADELAYKVESGMADRLVDVCVMLDTPTPGHKQSIRMDTGEILSTAPMEEHEYQQTIPFDEAEAEPDGDAGIIDAVRVDESEDEDPNPLRLVLPEDEV